MEDVDGWLSMQMLPDAAMDEEGYLTITTKAVPIIRTGDIREQPGKVGEHDLQLLLYHDLHFHPFITSQDGSVWEILPWKLVYDEQDHLPQAYALLLGRMRTRSKNRFFDAQALTKAMVTEKHAPANYHRIPISFVFNHLSYDFAGWEERRFSIGGPKMGQNELSLA